MDHEKKLQEVSQIIDPATLCEHCPFAPKTPEGDGQQTAAENALGISLQRQEIDRQIPLPFEDTLGGEWLLENEPESGEPKPFDDITHRLALAYLTYHESEAGRGWLTPADPVHGDASTLKAEVEHREQRAEREKAQGANGADQPDPGRLSALAYPATDEFRSSTARMNIGGVSKEADQRSAQEQKGTARQDGQHLAQTPHREAPKDVRGADREPS